MSYVRPVDMEQTLNYLYKNLSPGMERKLENFNGKRKISVYRGDHYLNKITRKLTEPYLTLIRYMQNIGTKADPKLGTKTIALKIPRKGDVLVYFNEAGDSTKGVTLNVFRNDFIPYKKNFANLMELREDEHFMDILSKLTGKDVRRPPKNHPKLDITVK